MQAFNTIELAVVEVGLWYFAAPTRRGGRRQPSLTPNTLAMVRRKQQLAREMARRRHEALSPTEVEALQARSDEAAKQARTAVKKDKISNLESLARTAEEAHKDRDPRAVYQVIRRLAPSTRLPARTVRCIATGEPCRHKQDEMEEIEKAMCQIYKGTSRPLDWQAPCSSSTTAVWQALSRAIKRLPNFKAAPKIIFGDALADTSTAMTRGSVAELYQLGVDSLALALAGCYTVQMNTEVNVSDLKFMDDLVSFFDFQELSTLQRFIECVSAVFTQHSFQVNVGKLEVCAVVACPIFPFFLHTEELVDRLMRTASFFPFCRKHDGRSTVVT